MSINLEKIRAFLLAKSKTLLDDWRPDVLKAAAIAATIVAFLCLAYGALIVAPPAIVDREVQRASGGVALTMDARLKAQQEVRGLFVQLLGGLVLGMGTWTAWSQLQTTRKRNADDARMAREGQVTTRFSKAIEHLQASSTAVRLGGIQALARIAKESEDDYANIVEIMTAHLREKCPWSGKAEPLRRVAPDVAIVVRELGLLQEHYGSFSGDFRIRIDLDGVDFGDPDGFSFPFDLHQATFRGSNLAKAHLSDKALYHVNFEGANLEGARLERSHLTATNFSGANLKDASLAEAHAYETLLTGANLVGADMAVDEAFNWDPSLARFDEHTKWPPGYDPLSDPMPTPESAGVQALPDGSWQFIRLTASRGY